LRECGVLGVLRRLISTPEEVIVAKALEVSPPRCPDCGSASLVRIGGIVKACGLRIQRFRCRVCGRTFTALEGTPLKGLHDIKFAVVVAYLVLCLGMEPKTITRATGRPYSTVTRLARRARENEDFFRKLFIALGVTSVTGCSLQ